MLVGFRSFSCSLFLRVHIIWLLITCYKHKNKPMENGEASHRASICSLVKSNNILSIQIILIVSCDIIGCVGNHKFVLLVTFVVFLVIWRQTGKWNGAENWSVVLKGFEKFYKEYFTKWFEEKMLWHSDRDCSWIAHSMHILAMIIRLKFASINIAFREKLWTHCFRIC